MAGVIHITLRNASKAIGPNDPDIHLDLTAADPIIVTKTKDLPVAEQRTWQSTGFVQAGKAAVNISVNDYREGKGRRAAGSADHHKVLAFESVGFVTRVPDQDNPGQCVDLPVDWKNAWDDACNERGECKMPTHGKGMGPMRYRKGSLVATLIGVPGGETQANFKIVGDAIRTEYNRLKSTGSVLDLAAAMSALPPIQVPVQAALPTTPTAPIDPLDAIANRLKPNPAGAVTGADIAAVFPNAAERDAYMLAGKYPNWGACVLNRILDIRAAQQVASAQAVPAMPA